MSAGDQEAAERRVQDSVRRHARTRAFAEAEAAISAVLSDPGVQEWDLSASCQCATGTNTAP